MQMFTVVLFIISKTQKQPRWPSTDEWIDQLWHIHTGILLSNRKTLAIKSRDEKNGWILNVYF
jgi:hypothetical protein